MSRADEIFKQNCRDIRPRRLDTELEARIWTTDARPRSRNSASSTAMTCARSSRILTLRRTYISKPRSTSCCGSGSRSRTTSTTCAAISGTAGPTKTAPSARPTAISWPQHHYPEGEMDQVDRALYDLKHNPASRRYPDEYLQLRGICTRWRSTPVPTR